MPLKSRSNGTAQWRNDGTAERRNGWKSSEILSDRSTERRKIPRNLKRRKDGKSPQILKDGTRGSTDVMGVDKTSVPNPKDAKRKQFLHYLEKYIFRITLHIHVLCFLRNFKKLKLANIFENFNNIILCMMYTPARSRKFRTSKNNWIPSIRISGDFPPFRLYIIPLFHHSTVLSFQLLGSPQKP